MSIIAEKLGAFIRNSRGLRCNIKLFTEQSEGSISCYIISMARTASDVLAVHLLLKEAGVTYHLPVVPLFETRRFRCL